MGLLGLYLLFLSLCKSQGIWGGGFGHVHMGYKRFSQMLVGVLGWEETLPWARQCNKLHSTICIVLLSEFVSQNAWLQQIHLPMLEMQVSLDQEDFLQYRMGTCSSILAWKIPWTEETCELTVHWAAKSQTWLGTQCKCPLTDEWIKMWYTYTMEYYSAIKRNEIWSFVEMWMDLESVIQSEVSQKEKNKYHILTQVESRKLVQMNLFAGQEYRCRCREQTCRHGIGWGKGEGWTGRLGLTYIDYHV